MKKYLFFNSQLFVSASKNVSKDFNYLIIQFTDISERTLKVPNQFSFN
jgi:hypothetical protein